MRVAVLSTKGWVADQNRYAASTVASAGMLATSPVDEVNNKEFATGSHVSVIRVFPVTAASPKSRNCWKRTKGSPSTRPNALLGDSTQNRHSSKPPNRSSRAPRTAAASRYVAFIAIRSGIRIRSGRGCRRSQPDKSGTAWPEARSRVQNAHPARSAKTVGTKHYPRKRPEHAGGHPLAAVQFIL